MGWISHIPGCFVDPLSVRLSGRFMLDWGLREGEGHDITHMMSCV